MVDVRIPHRVVYEVPENSAISDIIDSLRATEQLFFEVPGLLEGLVPGLHIGGVSVHIESLTQTSPLKELFWFTLAVAFQPTMEHDVPPVIEQLTGIHVPEHYEGVAGLLFTLIVLYGADFIYKQVNKVGVGSHIRAQLDSLVKELAAECGVDEDRVRKLMDARFEKRRLSNLIRSTAQFFSPSKRQGNAPILIGSRRVGSDIVAEFPNDAAIQDFDDSESSKLLQNVEIELHAQDVDRAGQGWAGVIRQVSSDRLRMVIYPPVKPEDIYTKQRITGDVVVLSRRASDGSMVPYLVHLIQLR